MPPAVVDHERDAPGNEADDRDRGPALTDRARGWLQRQDPSLLVMAIAVPVCLAVLLHLNRNQWFKGDEFAYLVDRRRQWGSGDRLGAILAPHNEHLNAGPFVLYMALFHVVRFSTYIPYLLLVYSFHVVLALALRALLVRAGTNRWLATGAAVLMLLLGAGMENLAWGFQVGFVGGVALGLVALVLSDHDEPMGWRDLAGVGLLVAAVAFQTIALPLVLAVAVNAAWHRRWRILAAYAGTATAAFAAWYLAIGRTAPRMPTSLELIAPYLWRGLTAAVDGTTQLTGGGAIIVVAVVFGLVRQARDGRLSGLVAATTVAAVAFFAMTGLGRASQGLGQVESSRYIYVGAALLLPALVTLLADLLAGNGRVGRIAAAGFLTWAVIGNLSAGVVISAANRETTEGSRMRLAATAALPGFRSLDPSVRPEPAYTPNIDIAALRDFLDHDGLTLPPADTGAVLAAAAELQVRAGEPVAGDPAAAAVTGLDGTTLTPERGCVRLRRPNGEVAVEARVEGLANVVVSESTGVPAVTVVGPDGGRVASPPRGSSLTLDHNDQAVVITVPSSRALLCGVHIGQPT